MSTKTVLLIVDPQNDFVVGALPVPGAVQAMDYLASWMQSNAQLYDSIIITMDQHPLGHCSFESMGGQWPPHCVKYSEGAALYPSIQRALELVNKPILYIEKATEKTRDEYSAFASRPVPEVLLKAERIYLAGLAGDYCVAECERDLLREIARERIKRLEGGIAYIVEPSLDT